MVARNKAICLALDVSGHRKEVLQDEHFGYVLQKS
jgi:hypothetical protein